MVKNEDSDNPWASFWSNDLEIWWKLVCPRNVLLVLMVYFSLFPSDSTQSYCGHWTSSLNCCWISFADQNKNFQCCHICYFKRKRLPKCVCNTHWILKSRYCININIFIIKCLLTVHCFGTLRLTCTCNSFGQWPACLSRVHSLFLERMHTCRNTVHIYGLVAN